MKNGKNTLRTTSANHIDLFTGIGGFTLACRWNQIQTEVFCENDKRCQNFLRKTYPDVPIVPDIRDFDGTKWQGRFLLTGGVPCQPASRAGKQRGKKDDRWLWPEAIRITKEAKPTWALFENPPGIYDVGIDRILSDLEGIGYEVGVLEIPACAVNAPHIRQRVWILAWKGENKWMHRPTTGFFGQEKCGWEDTEFGVFRIGSRAKRTCQSKNGGIGDRGDMADTGYEQRIQGRNDTAESEKGWSCNDTQQLLPKSEIWQSRVWLSCVDGKVRRAPDNTFGVAHGLHRSVLAALGNSIVPQVAYEIIRGILTTATEGGDDGR